jgi:hypothetical protein
VELDGAPKASRGVLLVVAQCDVAEFVIMCRVAE